MRTITSLITMLFLTAAPLIAHAGDCCCCEEDSAPAAASCLCDEETILRVLAANGIYLGHFADELDAGRQSPASAAIPPTAQDAAGGPEGLAQVEPLAMLVLEQAAMPPAQEADSPDLIPLVFHVPVNFNDGTPVPAALIEKLELYVCGEAGGFTVSDAEGAWEHEGKVYREPMRRYIVGIDAAQVAGFLAVIEQLLKEDMQQIAVWFEVDGDPEIR
jgi:hypothetical protein